MIHYSCRLCGATWEGSKKAKVCKAYGNGHPAVSRKAPAISLTAEGTKKEEPIQPFENLKNCDCAVDKSAEIPAGEIFK